MFTYTEIAAVTGGSIQGNCDGAVTAVSTDSRSVEPDQLFVALRGDRFDGHDFVDQLADKGIRAVLVDETNKLSVPATMTCITVPDTLRALGDLAAAYRR